MGFLKKSSAPSELPDLAMESLGAQPVTAPINVAPIAQPLPVSEPVAPQPITYPVPIHVATAPVAVPEPVVEKPKEVAGEDYLEFSHHEVAKKAADEEVSEADQFHKESFFDEVLEDINGGIADVGKLENWYKRKFVDEDVVSNMKGYWEGNKADIIISSFGAEYKRQINDKVKVLQTLEEDWREIYFKLVKKEEEMKKEERELKETVAEFVDLCKRRKSNVKEEEQD